MIALFYYLVAILSIVASEVYFEEEFFDDNYTNRWVESTHRGIDQGKFQLSAGEFFGDIWRDKGLQTSQNSKFYGISAKFDKPFDSKGKTLVIQYQLKMEEPIECGGGYIKILGSDFDQKDFHGHTPYKIMFGPDICGTDKRMVHVIINYKEKYYLIKKDIQCKDDHFSHLYTLVINTNNSYEVLIDNKKVETGKLDDDFDFLQPKKIKDPNESKPENWVDEKNIYDVNDTKPIGWDQPRTIIDPTAVRPLNYDEETHGIWEPPLVDNPDYKGKWIPRKIDNPDYKGHWVHPMIDNPDFEYDPDLYVQKDLGGLGFDIWQVVAGSIFDNILVTDDPAYAMAIGYGIWNAAYEDEIKIYQHKKDHERKQREEFQKLSDDDVSSNQEQDDSDDEGEDEILDETIVLDFNYGRRSEPVPDYPMCQLCQGTGPRDFMGPRGLENLKKI